MLKALERIWSNEYYKGGFFLTITSFIGNALNYFFSIFVGRSLGPSGLGEISTLFSYILITSVPITILSTIIIQKIGESENNRYLTTRSLEDFFLSKAKSWSLLIVLSLAIVPFLPKITNLSQLTAYSLFPLILISFFASFYTSALQGLKLFFLFSIIGLITTVFKLLGAVLAVVGIDGLTTIIIFLFISFLINLLGSLFFVRREVYKKTSNISLPKINKRLINVVTNPQFMVTTISVIGLTLFSSVDMIIVKKLFSGEQAGIYSSWAIFGKLIFYILGPVNSISFVFFSSKTNSSQQNKALLITLALLFFISVMSLLFYYLFPKFIVNLFFGRGFYSVVPLLGSSSLFGFFYAATIVINNFYLAKKSRYALILPLMIPFYLIFVFIIPRSLTSIINLNIIFSGAVTFLYLLFYFISTYRRNGEEKILKD